MKRNYLQMCDITVYVHRWRFTVFWNIFVVWRTALLVHRIHTGNRYVLIALSNVATTKSIKCNEAQGGEAGDVLSRRQTHLQMILSVRSKRLAIPLRSFLLICSETHTGVSARARVRGVSPSLFTMSMSAPLDRNKLRKENSESRQPNDIFLFKSKANTHDFMRYSSWREVLTVTLTNVTQSR